MRQELKSTVLYTNANYGTAILNVNNSNNVVNMRNYTHVIVLYFYWRHIV